MPTKEQIWKPEELEILEKYYPRMGSLIVSLLPGRNRDGVKIKARRLGIKLLPATKEVLHRMNLSGPKPTNKFLTDIFKLDRPETAYILGLLWADGCVSADRPLIRIIANVEDGEHIAKVLDLDCWSKYERVDNRGPNLNCFSFEIYDRRLARTLKEWGIVPGRVDIGPLLRRIPDSLLGSFLQGLLDGDGCWHVDKSHYYLTISSSYSQIWNTLQERLSEHSVDSRIRLRLSKKGKESSLIVYRHKSLLNLGRLVYCNGFSFGIPRKYEKWSSMLSKLNNSRSITGIQARGRAKFTLIEEAVIRNSVLTGEFTRAQLAKIHNVSWTCIDYICKKSTSRTQ